jgi:predicted enzyme related to lactoylglutathione lyase
MTSRATSDRLHLRWTGVCLDCSDADELAQFYSRLLGWTVTASDGAGWIRIDDPAGGVGLNFQAEAWYQPPVWPEEPGARDKMLRPIGDDLDEAIARVIAAGGSRWITSPRIGRRISCAAHTDPRAILSACSSTRTQNRTCRSARYRVGVYSRCRASSRAKYVGM